MSKNTRVRSIESRAASRPAAPLYVLLLLCALAGCHTGGGSSTEQRYELRGKVVSVDQAKRQVTIAHEEVRGYMAAMAMPFAIKDKELWALGVLAPGDQVSADLVVDGASSWLENLVIAKESVADPGAQRGAGGGEPRPGDEVPDFMLVNQDGKRVNLRGYRGKALLLTFIYTRCPLPDYCTLMSNNFAAIDQELRKDPTLYARTHLLSVSIDPEYDTPKVLRSYGAAHTGNYSSETFAHWEFASGTSEQVKEVAQFFGLTYWQDSDQIVHSLRTAVIAPDGKIFKIYHGNEWKPDEVVRDLQTLFTERPQ